MTSPRPDSSPDPAAHPSPDAPLPGTRRTADGGLEIGLAPQLRARLMGAALVAMGVLLVVVTVAVSLLPVPVGVLTAVVVLVLVCVFGLGFLLVRRWYVVRLDETGYRVRFVRGAGVRQARWADVEDLTTTLVAGAPCVVLRLREGTTTVPVELLAVDREAFVAELGHRLDRGNGYRRVR